MKARGEIQHADVRNVLVDDDETLAQLIADGKRRAIMALLRHDGPFTIFLGHPTDEGIVIESHGQVLTDAEGGQTQWYEALQEALVHMVEHEAQSAVDKPTPGDLVI